MRKPGEFERHPIPYAAAVAEGLFRAVCCHVTDGDTLDVFIDLGLYKYAYETIRLRGVNAPEIFHPVSADSQAKGFEAKRFVESLALNQPVLLRTDRDVQTFGRFVADVWVVGHDTRRVSLAQALRDAGLAV